MIPKIENSGQLVALYEAIKMSVVDEAWCDSGKWHQWFAEGELDDNLRWIWNEVWTEDECRAVIRNYTILRLGR